MTKRIRPQFESEPEAHLRIDTMLEKVIEQEGLHISTTHTVVPKRIRRKKTNPEKEVSIQIKAITQPPPRQDDIIDLDKQLIARVIKPGKKTSHRISIRHEEHEPSSHFVEIGGLAQEIRDTERLDQATTINQWGAPYQEPISIHEWAAEASDLYIDEVDPRLFIDQFTPADANIAYAERYGIWAKIRAPFIRWEVAREEGRLAQSEVEQIEVITPESNTVTEEAEKGIIAKVEEEVKEVIEEVKEYREEVITQVERAWKVPALVPKLDLVKALAGFAVLMLTVSLPAGAISLSRSVQSSEQRAREQSEQALAHVKSALQGEGQHILEWRKANVAFSQAQQELSQTNAIALALAQALPSSRRLYESAQSLLTAGSKAAQAGEALSEGFQRAVQDPGRGMGERVQVFGTYLEAATPLIDDAMHALSQVKPSALPQEIRGKVETLQSSLEQSRLAMREFKSLAVWLEQVLGRSQSRTYLFIFQNHTELRPTGGFMGSLAEVTIDRGDIKNIRVPGGGPYDLQGQLMTRVQPPKPLQLVSSRWEFQDANWFPDFPTSAKKIQWFWSKAGQPTIDGIIAINATFMEKMLEITGPIDMPEYGKVITAENFLLETQKAVELEYDKEENKPKKFIGDLMPKVLERIGKASREDWLKLLTTGTESLANKEIQMYFTREDEQAMIERLGWSGKLESSPADNLAIIETNIAGQKTDAVIDEQINHEVEIQTDGSIVATVTLKREHKGQKGELFRGVNNVSYLRVYVPQGSELLAAQGFDPPSAHLFDKPLTTDLPDEDLLRIEQHPRPGTNGVQITDEFDRTVFGGWIQLGPGQARETSFKYRLPFSVYDIGRELEAGTQPKQKPAYLIMYNNQSGKMNRTINTKIQWPAAWKATWSNNEQAASMSHVSDRDTIHAVLFEDAFSSQ